MKNKRRFLSLMYMAVTIFNATQVIAAGMPRSVDQVLEKYRDKVESRLTPHFHYAGSEWPPRELQ